MSYCFARIGMFALLTLVLGTATAFAQAQISGVVTDADTGEPLPGANVVINGTTQGSAADANGRYTIPGVASGTYSLVASFVGYEDLEKIVTVRGNAVTVNFDLAFANQALEALEIFASRAVDRETPVAATTVNKIQMETQLGSRDIPLILDPAPSVYATVDGGGAGDSRINVRGFNQRNVAVMINGVPVNDMENGWVYWSNWDGVGDATSSIQLQRGLSAVNLATPSIGGTLNILTDPTAMRRGVTVKQEVGSGSFLKTTAVASTGLVNGKYGLTVAGVRKTGDGVVDYAWTDAWAYYMAASYNINAKNRLDLFALGAPQKHGQRLFAQNIGVYSQDFAKDLDSYDQDAFSLYNEAGLEYNQNGAPISESYTGQQAVEDKTFDRHDSGLMMERENFYHKPQINLNWYSQLSDRMLLSTVVYYSGGMGGGTGTYGSSPVRQGFDPDAGSPFASLPWSWNWDATVERNVNNGEAGARTILRNSRNNQWTVGAISKLKLEVTEPLTVEFGVDWRTAEIEHYREVRDLLGAEFYNCTGSCASDFWSESESRRTLGDRIDYDFTNTVDWVGGFAQGEYKTDDMTVYGMAGLSTIKYAYTNNFRMTEDGSKLTSETDNIAGVQLKGGALLKVAPMMDLFANLGYVSKVPIVDGTIDDVAGIVNPDPQNEEFTSIEAGTFWDPKPYLRLKFNVYSTKWMDRTLIRTVSLGDGTEGLHNLSGLDALHKGIEIEAAYQTMPLYRIDLAASFNDWTYTGDAQGKYRPDEGAETYEYYNYFIRDLKVGDAPQTQIAGALSLYPVDGLMVQGVVKHFANHYADFDPLSRTDRSDREQSWRTPAYQVVDLHASYDLPLRSTFGVQVFAHVFNLLDTMYIADALDNSQFSSWDQDHDADDAEVFFGLPRTVNFGIRATY